MNWQLAPVSRRTIWPSLYWTKSRTRSWTESTWSGYGSESHAALDRGLDQMPAGIVGLAAEESVSSMSTLCLLRAFAPLVPLLGAA